MTPAAKKPSLAERMARKASDLTPAPGETTSVSASFKNAGEEYPKRLTLDLTLAQHKKLKMRALNEGTPMAQILRDYIDTLSD